MPTASQPPVQSSKIDNTDWLKTAAIIFVIIDHFGYFFVDDAQWWSVFGRLAAPIFFFLLGFAKSKTVPVSWIVVGIILTLLESWNEDWSWVTPNILLSFALVRFLRPGVQTLLQKYQWIAFALLTITLVAALPFAAEVIDYGAEGWLWALFGLCQRNYADNMPKETRRDQHRIFTLNWYKMPVSASMRLIACLVAASIYLWQEQLEFEFSNIQLAACILGICVLSLTLMNFRRGPSNFQPPNPIANVVGFTGRRTLEIYAIQLGGSELIVKFFPDLAA